VQSGGTVACVFEVVGAFVGGDLGAGFGDGVGDGVEGARRGFSHVGFELGEDRLDRIEVGRVFGQEQEPGVGGLDRLAHRLSLVRSQLVERDDVVGLEGRDQDLLDLGAKALAVDRTVEQAGRLDAGVAQGGEKGRGVPMPMPDRVDEPLAARRKSP